MIDHVWEITLDDAHVYRVNGEIKPGTTQILDHNGLISEFCKQEFAAKRGEAIHQGGALLFQDNLEWNTVDPRIYPYLQSLDLFIKTAGFYALTVEQKGYHRFGFCGKWDVTGFFAGSEFEAWLLDLKSGAPAKWHKAQTAAYQQMANTARRGCLYLQADGSLAKLVEHTEADDWRAFQYALRIYRGEQSLQKPRDELKNWLRND